MELHTLPNKAQRRRKIQMEKIPPSTTARIKIEANSLGELLKKSLRGLSHELKPGLCSSSSHSDCTMKIKASSEDVKGLLVDFLSKVLALTHAHHTIFGTMYIEELTENKLIAQVYGNWFDRFDTRIQSIAENGHTVARSESGSYLASIVFN